MTEYSRYGSYSGLPVCFYLQPAQNGEDSMEGTITGRKIKLVVVGFGFISQNHYLSLCVNSLDIPIK